MMGGGDARHLEDVARDGLRLPALLRLDARIGAGRVDEAQDRPAELAGHLHDSERLAVAVRARHAEVARDALARVAPLLVAEHDDGPAVVDGRARDDGGVIRKAPVAAELDEVLAERLDDVERVRALGMPGDQRLLPGRQLGVDLCLQIGDPLLELGALAIRVGAEALERQILLPELEDGLLEVLFIQLHAPMLPPLPPPRAVSASANADIGV